MVVKRQLQEEKEEEEKDGIGIPLLKSKGMLSFPMYLRRVISELSNDHVLSQIENRLRLMVRKEVEHAVSCFFGPSPRSLPSDAHREGFLQLRFVGRLPSPIFTESKILADDGSPIRIELWDTRTNCIVHAGALSTIKIQIVPLNDDFGSDEEEDWNEGKFSANVVHERQGKRPLIVGEKSIALREGVADVVGIRFTDNSKWTWSRHFRLGARTDPEIPRQEWIKAARSSRFIVKDRRGEFYKKHYPPSLNDEVWRLNKIAKNGLFHSRLVTQGISTVKEFLCWLEIDPSSLREILGSNVSNKVWNAIVEHAVSCLVNADEHESYVYTDSSTWLWFDCVCKLFAASFDCGQTFNPPDDLPVPQKLLLQDLKREAYKHTKEWIRVPSASNALPMDVWASASSPTKASFGPGTSSQHPDFLLPSGSTYNEVEAPFPFINPPVQPQVTDASYAGVELWPRQQELETAPFSQSSTSMPGNTWTLRSEAEPAAAHLLSRLYSFGAHIPTYRKRRGGWCKIRAAVTFRLLRRAATARRRAKWALCGNNRGHCCHPNLGNQYHN